MPRPSVGSLTPVRRPSWRRIVQPAEQQGLQRIGLGSISGAALSEAQFSDDVELARPVSLHCYRPQPLLAVACPALQSLLNWAALHLPSRDSLTQFSDLTGIVVTGVLIDNGDRSGDRKPSRGARNRRRPGCSSHDPVAKAYPTVG